MKHERCWNLWRRVSRQSGGVFDWPAMLVELETLDKRVADPGLWADPKEAQATMRRLTVLRDQVNDWGELTRRVDDAIELVDLAEMEEDAETLEVMAQEAADLQALVDKRELKLALSGEHDEAGAILTLHAGEGGTEAQDWTQMMLRMYLRWAERHGSRPPSPTRRPAKKRASRRSRSRSRAPGPTAICTARRATTAWCASAPSIPTPAATPHLPRSRSCPSSTTISTSRFTPTTCAWMCSCQGGPAARTCRRTPPPCA